MIKKIALSVVLLTSALSSLNSFAEGGKINFFGTITRSPCNFQLQGDNIASKCQAGKKYTYTEYNAKTINKDNIENQYYSLSLQKLTPTAEILNVNYK